MRQPGKISRERAPSHGLVLLEILAAAAILVLLAGLALPPAMNVFGRAKVETTADRIDQLAGALAFFHADNGRYPTSAEGLKALLIRPPDLPTWNGPYLAKSDIPLDAWHQPFVYEAGDEAGESYWLYSEGMEGRSDKPGADLAQAASPTP